MNIEINSKLYDFLNSLVRYILPAAGAAYFALSDYWGLPKPLEVVGTVTIVTTFLGVVIALARKGWKADEELLVDSRDPNEVNFGFESGLLIDDLKDGQVLTVHVNKVGPESTRDSF